MSCGDQFDAASKKGGSHHIMRSMCDQFNNPETSDLELKVGNETFHVHKFVLGLLSDVFRTMCSRRWEGDRGILQIQECDECLPVFKSFLKFLYSGDVEIDASIALPFLMLADKYNVQPLKNIFEDFMKKTVKDGSITGALQWFAYAQLSGHRALQFSCVDVIITKMDEVIASDDFLQLEAGFLVALLGRDDLVVLWEKALYDAVVRWIEARSGVTNDELVVLMKLVRFPTMFADQLHDIEMSVFYDKNKDMMSPLLNNAHRFRSLATAMNDIPLFSDSMFRPRNYTHRWWCHFMTIETNGDAFFQNSVGVRCVNHPVVTASEQLWQIKIMGEKRSSRNFNGNKPTLLPNLGYVLSPTMGSSAVKVIPLTMTITPLRPLEQDIAVDISLYQVKKDRLSRYLCGETLKYSPNDYFDIFDDGCTQRRGSPCAPSLQSTTIISAHKFNPSPMSFSVRFQQAQIFDKPEVVLRYNFAVQDFDHPAEIPCFKLNGPTRSTNSIRIAVIFKPRFLSPLSAEDGVEDQTSMPAVTEDFDSSVCDVFDSDECDDTGQ